MPDPFSDGSFPLALWVRILANHMSQDLALRLAPRGITVAEWSVMHVLHEQKLIAPNLLADQMAMTRGAISKLADRLIKKGLVVRQLVKDDGRAQTLALTSRGETLVLELDKEARDQSEFFFAGRSGGDRDTFDRVIKKMVEVYRISLASGSVPRASWFVYRD